MSRFSIVALFLTLLLFFSCRKIECVSNQSRTVALLYRLKVLNSDSSIKYRYPTAVEATSYGTEVKWTVYFEQDIIKYYVQRSIDGVIFQNVGLVEPFNGGEVGVEYLFIDVAK